MREIGWTYEYIEDLDICRFVELIEDFGKLPTVAQVMRTQVLMPGDKGFKKVDPEAAKRVVNQTIAPAGKEPEWMRNARLKAEARFKELKESGTDPKRWTPKTIRR